MLRRHQLPVLSPISARAFVSGLTSRALNAAGELESARELVATEFAADAVVLVDSGRSALGLAITHALAGKSPRVVALPAFQCYEVATAAVGADCGIALYDVDPATLRPDLESVERVLRAGAKAIVVAPLYGIPVEWEELLALAAKYDAFAIEDAAQANGAEWKGRRLGSLGQVSVVSFGRGKGWSGGGGGALLFRGHQSAAEVQRRLVANRSGHEAKVVMLTMLQLAFGRASLYGFPAGIPSLGLGETRYHEPTTPARMAGFSAALLRRTLAAARREAQGRRRIARHWKDSLPRELALGIPAVLPDGIAGYLRFPLRLQPESADLANDAARRVGVARSYPRPLNELPPVAARMVETTPPLPGAGALARELVTLPTHSHVAPRDFEEILALCVRWRAPSPTQDQVRATERV